MDNVKPWYASRTLWGAALAIVSGLVPGASVILTPEVSAPLIDGLSALGSVVGGAIAVWGRVAADSVIATSPGAGAATSDDAGR